MQVIYSDIESQIVSRLQPMTNGGGVDVLILPEVEDEFQRPFGAGRVTVAYKSSDFPAIKSTHEIVQDELLHFEVVVQARKLRSPNGVHAMVEAIKKLLVGFRPTDCSKMYLVKNGFTSRDPETAVWTYSMIFETKYLLVEDGQDETGPKLEILEFIYNDEFPAIPTVPFPGTFPNPPIEAYYGDVAYWDGMVWRRLSPGEVGQVLATQGIGLPPQWISGGGGEPGPQGPQGEQGEPGPQGEQGIQGEQGPAGEDGKSAYELALEDGFVGTLEDWLASLVGEQGEQGIQGPQGEPGPQGEVGPQGPQGESGVIGLGLVRKAQFGGTVTGTTSQTLVHSYAFAANEINFSDVLHFEAQFVRSSSVSNGVIRLYLNTQNTLVGAVPLLTNSMGGSTNTFSQFRRKFGVRAGTIIGFPPTTSSATDLITNGNPVLSAAINVAAPFWILLTYNPSNAGDTATCTFSEIKNF
jgi:hypothetical protein